MAILLNKADAILKDLIEYKFLKEEDRIKARILVHNALMNGGDFGFLEAGGNEIIVISQILGPDRKPIGVQG